MKNKLLLFLFCAISFLLSACADDVAHVDATEEQFPTYKIILSGNDDPHDLAILKKRLNDHVGKKKYTFEEKEDKIIIQFDGSACQEMGIDSFVGTWLCNPGAYSISKVVRKDFLGMANVTKDVFILRDLQASDIENMEIVTVQNDGDESEESTENEIPVIDFVDAREHTFLDITFTKEAWSEIKKLQSKYENLSVCRGKTVLSGSLKEGVFRIPCSAKTESDTEYLLYSMKHDKLNSSYTYKIFYDEKEWEEGYCHFVFRPKENRRPYLDERNRTLEIFQSRLDELGMEYEISQNTDGIISLSIKGDVNEGLMSALCTNSISLYDDRSVLIDGSVTLDTDLNAGKIHVYFDDYYDDSISGEIHLRLGNFPIAQTRMNQAPKGGFEFTQMCFSSEEYNTFSSKNPYARFIAKILTGDPLPYEMTIDCCDSGEKDFDFPLPDLTNRDEVIKEIRKKYPDATFRISYTSHCFAIDFHLDPESIKMEELVRDLAMYTEMMEAKDGLDMIFYPCDLYRDEYFMAKIDYYLSSNETEFPPKGAVYFTCHNGRMDALKDAFYSAAREEGVFAEARKYEKYYVEADMD